MRSKKRPQGHAVVSSGRSCIWVNCFCAKLKPPLHDWMTSGNFQTHLNHQTHHRKFCCSFLPQTKSLQPSHKQLQVWNALPLQDLNTKMISLFFHCLSDQEQATKHSKCGQRGHTLHFYKFSIWRAPHLPATQKLFETLGITSNCNEFPEQPTQLQKHQNNTLRLCRM